MSKTNTAIKLIFVAYLWRPLTARNIAAQPMSTEAPWPFSPCALPLSSSNERIWNPNRLLKVSRVDQDI